MAGYQPRDRYVDLDGPTVRGGDFLLRLRAVAQQTWTRTPSPSYDPMPGNTPGFGYQEALTTLGSFWREVPSWTINGPPTSRPKAPALVQALPSSRVTAARAAFYQNLPKQQ